METIDKVKQMIANGVLRQEDAEKYFPELKESNDERIRKAIIEGLRAMKSSFHTISSIKIDDAIAWLEKQGEKKAAWTPMDEQRVENLLAIIEGHGYPGEVAWLNSLKDRVQSKQDEQKDSFKMKTPEESLDIDSETYSKIVDECIYGEQKPKFRVGDWVVYECEDEVITLQIKNIVDGTYEFTDDSTLNVVDEDTLRLWTIQDAKAGDVLVNQNGEMPFMFKECKDNHIYCYCGYTNRKDIFFDKFVDSENEELHWLNLYHEQAHPATKEQRDLLFQKMKEAGYEWDTKKKELKKIEKNLAWSEEDDEAINLACSILYSNFNENENFDKNQMCIGEIIEKLKSLRPHNTWKPSESDIRILEQVIDGTVNPINYQATLHAILEKLKKLKEE